MISGAKIAVSYATLHRVASLWKECSHLVPSEAMIARTTPDPSLSLLTRG